MTEDELKAIANYYAASDKRVGDLVDEVRRLQTKLARVDAQLTEIERENEHENDDSRHNGTGWAVDLVREALDDDGLRLLRIEPVDERLRRGETVVGPIRDGVQVSATLADWSVKRDEAEIAAKTDEAIANPDPWPETLSPRFAEVLNEATVLHGPRVVASLASRGSLLAKAASFDSAAVKHAPWCARPLLEIRYTVVSVGELDGGVLRCQSCLAEAPPEKDAAVPGTD